MATREDRSSPVPLEVEVHASGRARDGVDAAVSSRSSRTGTLAVLAVLVAVVAVLALVDRSGDPAGVQRLRLPGSVQERWRTELETAEVYEIAGSDDIVVAAVGWDTTLVALGRDTGEVRWQQEVATGRSWLVRVVGDVVVVETSPAQQHVEVVALAAEDGEVLWRRTLNDDQGVSSDQPLVLTTRGDSVDDATIEALDPRTGRVVARTTGAVLGEGHGQLIVQHGDEIQLRDARTLRRSGGFRLTDDLDIGRLHGVAYRNGSFILAGTRGVALVHGGKSIGRVEVPASYATIAGDAFAVSGSDGWVDVYAASSDGLEHVARYRGTAIGSRHGEPPILLVHPAGPSRSFEQPLTLVVDALTGEQIGRPQRHRVSVADNGYVTLLDGPSDGSAVIGGHMLNGQLLWTIPHDPFGQFHVIDEAIVAVSTDISSATTTLTLHG